MKALGLNGAEMNCCFKSDAQTRAPREQESRGMRLEKPLLREWLREKSAVRERSLSFVLVCSPQMQTSPPAAFVLQGLGIKFNF
jgi:hypothetical protein